MFAIHENSLEPEESDATIDQQYRFAGREYDAETGILQFRMRDYEPSTGLFLQQDPAGLGADGPNQYAYALADPINKIDPSGLSASIDFVNPRAEDARKQLQGTATSLVSQGLVEAAIRITDRLADAARIPGLAPMDGSGSNHCNAKSNQTGNHVYMIYRRLGGQILKFGVANNKLLYSGGRRSRRADPQVDHKIREYTILLITPDGFYSRGLALALEKALVVTYGSGDLQKLPTTDPSSCPLRGRL